MTLYNDYFYDEQTELSYSSATRMLRLLFSYIRPASVLDVGCGRGTWLQACNELGVEDYLGLDGSYVDVTKLRIPEGRFCSKDLSSSFTLERRFDLVISMEVAEHLNLQDARIFINNLTLHSDVILFSAAVPYQGGTGHVNENWAEFWALLFRSEGFEPLDILRSKLWDDRNVAFWYKQNTLLYVKSTLIDNLGLRDFKNSSMPLSIIHPEMYLWACSRALPEPAADYEGDSRYKSDLTDAWLQGRAIPKLRTYGSEYEVHFGRRARLLKNIKRFIRSIFPRY